MPTRAVALLSGGLDSMLAIRVLQEQGIEVEALNFRTLFTCCKDESAEAARELGVRLTVVSTDDAYLDVIRRPAYGYGRGANPCIDCRIYMFRIAERFMKDVGAVLVASGEVVGQRPMSQKRRDLGIIARQSELDDRLLRPLSAKLLPPTAPEREGLVDRERLYGFSGRSRKGLIELARQFGFRRVPTPSTGCALTERAMATKVHDLLQLDPDNTLWDFELLRVGRHVRFDGQTKVVVGRRAEENQMLEYLAGRDDARLGALLWPENFNGPAALVTGPITPEALGFAGGLVLRYAREPGPEPRVWLTEGGVKRLYPLVPDAAALTASAL